MTQQLSDIVAVAREIGTNMPYRKAVILVVEDNAIIRMGAVDLVTAAGFEALEAEDAADAMQVLESGADIHLVFTDVGLPGSMDGVALAFFIRNRWPAMLLIMTSGRTNFEQSHLPQGTRFFLKPYDDNSIVEAMIQLLG